MAIFGEMRRRNIFKVSLAYVVLAWLIVQAAYIAVPAIGLPDRTTQLLVLALILGFPILVLLAWAYELTPQGLKPTADVDKTQSITHETGRRLNNIVVALLLLAAAVMLTKQFIV